MDQISKRVARLRGPLQPKSPGARGLERAARNLSCDRLQALTIAGIDPVMALENIYEGSDQEGQSPFAISAGDRFEKHLTKNCGEELHKLYREAGRLEGEIRVLDLKARYPGKGTTAVNKRIQVTLEIIERKIAGDPTVPNLVFFSRLALELPGQKMSVEPDVLVSSNTDQFYRIAEIKSYYDRRGKTDPAKIRGACRQSAVNLFALRSALSNMLSQHEIEDLLPAEADLILRRPGSFTPTLRPMTLEAELVAVQSFFASLETNLERITDLLPPDQSLADRSALNSLETNYQSSCREFCALASVCKEQACERSDPIFLGDGQQEQLAPVQRIDRALELLHGIGAPPANGEEQELKARLQKAFCQHRKAVGYEG